MAEKKLDPTKITMIGVRLSFASLAEPNVQKNEDGSTRETWKGNFLIPKDGADEIEAVYMGQRMPILKAIGKASNAAKEKKWGAPGEDQKNWPKLKADRKFFRDGDEENWDGYEGQHYVSANAQINEPPQLITNRRATDGKWMKAQPGAADFPYSGCYVNATISVWVQDNEHGKRINARLKAVQFRQDGEPFGAAPVDVEDEFDDDMVGTTGDMGGDFDDDGGSADADEDLV